MSDESLPNGPWKGFYVHSGRSDRHRMDLSLTFRNATMRGDGSDDIGKFIIQGRFDLKKKEFWWTKQYVGRHSVFYKGFKDGFKGIWGTWEIGPKDRGGFKIWPVASGENADGQEANAVEQPVADAVGHVLVGN
jgi:hypothetical protein